MEKNMYEKYALGILHKEIDPFKISFEQFELEQKKQQQLIGFVESSDDIGIVLQYLLDSKEESLLEDLKDAVDCEDFLDVAEQIIFNDLEKEMAKIIINKALKEAQTVEDYVSIAELFIEEFLDKSKAKELYKKASENITTTQEAVYLADSIADEEYLSDKEWAIEVCQIGMSLAKNIDDFFYLARSLSYLDIASAKEVLDVVATMITQTDKKYMIDLAYGYSVYANNPTKAKEFFIKAIANSQNFEEFFTILEKVAQTTLEEEFFRRILKVVILSMQAQEDKQKVAAFVLEKLSDEKLSQFLATKTLQEVQQFFAIKDLEDLKLLYAQQILEGKIDPKEIVFESFVQKYQNG